MQATWADIGKARAISKWQPEVGLEEGIKRTVAWTEENWQWLKDMPV
jgi:nucleoside-diphosphate-sugar epimerase